MADAEVGTLEGEGRWKLERLGVARGGGEGFGMHVFSRSTCTRQAPGIQTEMTAGQSKGFANFASCFVPFCRLDVSNTVIDPTERVHVQDIID